MMVEICILKSSKHVSLTKINMMNFLIYEEIKRKYAHIIKANMDRFNHDKVLCSWLNLLNHQNWPTSPQTFLFGKSVARISKTTNAFYARFQAYPSKTRQKFG